MGIADDISPQRGHHTHFTHDPEPKAQEVYGDQKKDKDKEAEIPIKNDMAEKVKPIKDGDLFTPNHADDFFPPEKKLTKKDDAKPKLEKHEGRHRKSNFSWRRAIRRLLGIAIIVILTIIIYSNFDSIKETLIPGSTTSKTDNNAVTIVPQDYTSETAESPNAADDTSSTTGTATDSTTTTSTDATTTTTDTATATTPDKTNATIQVLNGSRVDGAAATYKAILSKAGYTVSAIGNAANSEYWSTYVYYKTGYDAIAADIKTTLSRKSTLLRNDDSMTSKYDIIVIMGSH